MSKSKPHELSEEECKRRRAKAYRLLIEWSREWRAQQAQSCDQDIEGENGEQDER
jgi:hypothetical protein